MNQLRYEPDVGFYDIVEPIKNYYFDSPFLHRVRNVYTDISEVPGDSRYDRITSVATFEHIFNLPEVVARSGLLLETNGMLRTGIPSEGSFLWALGWRLTTRIEFKIKYGLDYGLLMKYEHVNNARDIEEVLKFFFDDIECSYLGLTKSVSLYRFFTCRHPEIEKCREYVSSVP